MKFDHFGENDTAILSLCYKTILEHQEKFLKGTTPDQFERIFETNKPEFEKG